jgi:hypothetical protein
MMANANILIGTFVSNFVRLPMELRAARYGLASNLFLEAGEQRCVSMAHCEYHNIPWEFDFYTPTRTSWEAFEEPKFGEKNTEEELASSFARKFTGPDPLPTSIEHYLSVAGPRSWP